MKEKSLNNVANYKKRDKPRDKNGRFIKGFHYSPETEFKKGEPPKNFGKGQFKKGHRGYNKKPNSGSFKKGQPNINKNKRKLWGPNKGSFHEGHMPWMKGKFGEKASNWKNGRTIISEAIRKSKKYAIWRLKIYEKDNFSCRFCGKRGGKTKLEAHHIIPFNKILENNNIRTTKEAVKCEKLWNINNALTLCSKCHNLNKEGRRKKYL